MHAEGDVKKSVRQANNTVKTNTKLMLALVQRSIFRTKFDEKSHVFWDVDFGWILGGFWEVKILDFHTFFDVFSKSFLKHAWEGQKIDPRGPTRRRRRKFSDGFRWSPPSWGEKKRGDQEPRPA